MVLLDGNVSLIGVMCLFGIEMGNFVILPCHLVRRVLLFDVKVLLYMVMCHFTGAICYYVCTLNLRNIIVSSHFLWTLNTTNLIGVTCQLHFMTALLLFIFYSLITRLER